MKRIIAIGGSHAETLAFARQIEEKHLRYVTNRDFIRGLRPDVVHLLPGYFTRRDRHAVAAEVKVMERKNRQLVVTTWVKAQGVFVEALDLNNLDIEVVVQPVLPEPAEEVPEAAPHIVVSDWENEGGTIDPEPIPELKVSSVKPKVSPAKPKPAKKPAAKKAPAKKTPVVEQPEIDFIIPVQDRVALTQDAPAPIAPKAAESDFYDFLDSA